MEESETDGMGVLLVLVLVLVLCAVGCGIGLIVKEIYLKVLEKRRLDQKLAQTPELFNTELNEHLIDYKDLVFGEVLGSGAQGQVRKAIWQERDGENND